MMGETATYRILETGLLGALLVLSGICILYLYKELRAERNARLQDMKNVWQEDIKFRTELRGLLDSILGILRKGGI